MASVTCLLKEGRGLTRPQVAKLTARHTGIGRSYIFIIEVEERQTWFLFGLLS